MARTLSQGMSGQDVRVLQDRLNYHLRRETPLVVDGIFGTKTKARVVQFQTVNTLAADGLVGPKTNAVLFAADVVNAQILFMPELTLPPIGTAPRRFGIKPPQLIPPLVFDPFPKPPQFVLPPPILLGPQFTLNGTGMTGFQPVNKPSLLNLTFTLTPVQDPTDPVVQSHKNLVQIVNQIPVDSKFKAMIISAIPSPITVIKEPKTGFDVDIGPPKYNPFDPTKITQSGGAKYTLRLFGRSGSPLPQVFLQGRAEGEIEINYTGQAKSNYFKASADGNFFLGVVGVF